MSIKSRIAVLSLVCVVLLITSPLGAAASAPDEAAEVPTAKYASLGGIVFQDFCKVNCVAGSSLNRGNGVPNTAEPRLANILVGLSRGACRLTQGVFRWTRTNAQGGYSFTGLAAGTYCVMVNSRQSGTAFVKPGVWSRPSGRSSYYLASYTVRLTAGQAHNGLYFGWDHK